MKTAMTILVSALVLASQTGQAHDSAATKPAVSESKMHHAAGHNAAPYDLQYLDTMSKHHQGAIDMAKMAVDKSSNVEIKAFAQEIIGKQTEEIKQFKSWRSAWYGDKPDASNMQMHGMKHSMEHMDMDKMMKASGTVFDHHFLTMMIPHHQGAIDMSKKALKKATHPEVRDAARKIIDDQQKEIVRLRQWLSMMKTQ